MAMVMSISKTQIDLLKRFVDRFNLEIKNNGEVISFDNAIRILNNEKPNPRTKDERRADFVSKLRPYLDKYGKDMLNKFYFYWCRDEGVKLKFETQKSWDLELRLARWKANDDEYERKKWLNDFDKRI